MKLEFTVTEKGLKSHVENCSLIEICAGLNQICQNCADAIREKAGDEAVDSFESMLKQTFENKEMNKFIFHHNEMSGKDIDALIKKKIMNIIDDIIEMEDDEEEEEHDDKCDGNCECDDCEYDMLMAKLNELNSKIDELGDIVAEIGEDLGFEIEDSDE